MTDCCGNNVVTVEWFHDLNLPQSTSLPGERDLLEKCYLEVGSDTRLQNDKVKRIVVVNVGI